MPSTRIEFSVHTTTECGSDRYRAELSRNTALLNELRTIAKKGRLTLVYAALDEVHNKAVMLRDVLTH